MRISQSKQQPGLVELHSLCMATSMSQELPVLGLVVVVGKVQACKCPPDPCRTCALLKECRLKVCTQQVRVCACSVLIWLLARSVW